MSSLSFTETQTADARLTARTGVAVGAGATEAAAGGGVAHGAPTAVLAVLRTVRPPPPRGAVCGRGR